MKGFCTQRSQVRIEDILEATKSGMIALFKIDSRPLMPANSLVGKTVYIHNDKVWDYMSDEHIPNVEASDLHFVGYVYR